MSVILDASLTLAWCSKDESTAHTNAVLEHVATRGAVVPTLWVYEVANGLVSGLRRSPPRIQDGDIERFLQALSAMPIEVAPAATIATCKSVLKLAAKHSISAYDAAYLDLALQLGLPIGTLDGTGRRHGLKQAAEATGVLLFRPR